MPIKKRFDIGRAGKVKNQTPKVERTTDKNSKKNNGRAKKRRLYNKLLSGFTGNVTYKN